jgi:hypothetical protein
MRSLWGIFYLRGFSIFGAKKNPHISAGVVL